MTIPRTESRIKSLLSPAVRQPFGASYLTSASVKNEHKGSHKISLQFHTLFIRGSFCVLQVFRQINTAFIFFLIHSFPLLVPRDARF